MNIFFSLLVFVYNYKTTKKKAHAALHNFIRIIFKKHMFMELSEERNKVYT